MKEIILTENIDFNSSNSSDSSYTFPSIQEHLDGGFTVKHIFYTPLAESGVYGISLTVHLQKSE